MGQRCEAGGNSALIHKKACGITPGWLNSDEFLSPTAAIMLVCGLGAYGQDHSGSDLMADAFTSLLLPN